MPPQAIQLAIFAIEEGIKLEPQIAAAIKSLFANKTVPTATDWDNLRAAVASGDYSAIVTNTGLTPGQIAAAEGGAS